MNLENCLLPTNNWKLILCRFPIIMLDKLLRPDRTGALLVVCVMGLASVAGASGAFDWDTQEEPSKEMNTTPVYFPTGTGGDVEMCHVEVWEKGKLYVTGWLNMPCKSKDWEWHEGPKDVCTIETFPFCAWVPEGDLYRFMPGKVDKLRISKMERP